MAYEQIIAGKLGSLPLPDMADAIWARIETQLDLDLPQDGPPDAGPTPRFPTGGTIIGGLSIFFVIVFVAFFLTSKKQNAPSQFNNKPASTTLPTQKRTETFPQNNTVPSPLKTNSATTTLPLPVPQVLDSNTFTVQSFSPTIDSAASNLTIAITPLPEPAKKDTVQPVKKGRGVSGIKEDDYRIVPKKDTTNNR